ncbi:hypothetical protein [Azospirillum palustre]
MNMEHRPETVSRRSTPPAGPFTGSDPPKGRRCGLPPRHRLG